ncbi:MAG: aldehyde dehydrogenase family protein [Halioglobus sp.]
MSEFSLVVDGQLVRPNETFSVINPADETVVAECPKGNVDLLNQAVVAARKAQPAWAALPDEERVKKLHLIADLIQQNHEELSLLMTREQGKCQSGLGANMEIGGCEGWTRVTAGLELPVEVIQDDDTGRIEMHRKPVGVVASITPWNWPAMIAIWHIMPALRVGCTVVAKPATDTPLTILRLVELMNQVLPPGVVNVVTGSIGDEIATHPDIDKIVFTGSTAIGKRVLGNSVGTLKRTTLELGGNDAGIVLPGTNIDAILEELFWGAFINGGQTCASLKRLYVHESQYEEVCEKLTKTVNDIAKVGNGLDPENNIGPLTNRSQQQFVKELVDDARANGARVLTGGQELEGSGYFYSPTLVADVDDDTRLVSEEQFGPALPIIKYSSVDEAVERANSLDVGLGGSVWGDDRAQALEIASRMECGSVWINSHGKLNPMAPFGGVKSSGIGVEFGVEGLREYTTIQVVHNT